MRFDPRVNPEQAPHPAFAPLLIGQVVEWLVWSRLVSSGAGDLRVFLPTRDMGIDGVIQRHSTDELVCVQVKGRTRLENGILRIHVQEDEVRDPRTVVIAVYADLVTNTLHEPAIVLTAAQLRTHARLIEWGPRRAYPITVPYPPGHRTHWADTCVALDAMGDRVVPPPPGRSAAPPPPAALPDVAPAAAADQETLATTGFIGESALLHHAALSPRLNTFHAFPDVSFTEYLVRNVQTGTVTGYQVKCIEVDAEHPAGVIHIPRNTLSVAAHSRLIVFIRRRDGDVVSPCLVIPAAHLERLTHPTADRRLTLMVNPGNLGPLAPYAVSLADLPARLEQ